MLAAVERRADGPAGAMPCLQGQEGPGPQRRRRAVRLSGADGGRHFIYDSDIVPVGEDQTQHIEVARDLAASFNHEFGETFVMPKAKVLDGSARVPGSDGEKMSKSYGNTLEVFEEPKAAAEADHADRHRFAADGAAQGARRGTTSTSSIRCLPRRRSERRWPRRIAAAASAMAR